jgi:hypothetical protein
MGTCKTQNSMQDAGSALARRLITIRTMNDRFHRERAGWGLIGGESRVANTRNVNFPHPKRCDASHCRSYLDGLTMTAVHPKFHLARARDCSTFSWLAVFVLTFLIPAMGWAFDVEKAQRRDASTTRTTVVVFADRPMGQVQWDALFSALRVGVANGGAETALLDAEAEFVRGDSIVAGVQVEKAIVVFLHGDCSLAPAGRRTAFGVPLGWVWRRHGLIEPFAHVDCTRIGQVLGPQALRMSQDQRNRAMAGAIARVIVHEWIHIATQNPEHAERGVRKAQFGVADLMAGGD